MLHLLVVGMLEVLMVLVVLEEVFIGGISERVQSPNIFFEKILESQKKSFGTKTLTLKSYISLFPKDFLSFVTI